MVRPQACFWGPVLPHELFVVPLLKARTHMLRTGVFCRVKESVGMCRGADYCKIPPLRLVQTLLGCEDDVSLSIFVYAHF